MPESTTRRIVMAARPKGAPRPSDFRLEEAPLPSPGPGEVLVRTEWLSLDPYMRGRMSDAPSYTAPVQPGEVMQGEGVGVVLASHDPAFAPGDRVQGHGGWQSRFVMEGARLRRVETGTAPPQAALGVLGMPGLTAYAAVERLVRPKAGETVLVGAATGAVGAIAGQLAKAKGARAVGIAGGPEKCIYATRELGFDACLDRHEPDLAGRLARACPDGIDGSVELTGGDPFWAALPLLTTGARVAVVGTIAWYNQTEPPAGSDRTPLVLRTILVRRLEVRGLIVFDHADLEPAFRREVGELLGSGRLRAREEVVEGLERAPEAFIGLLEGRNFGKLLVKLES